MRRNHTRPDCVQPGMDELIDITMWNCEMVECFFDHGIEYLEDLWCVRGERPAYSAWPYDR